MTDLTLHLRHAGADLYLARCSLEQAMVGATADVQVKLRAAIATLRLVEREVGVLKEHRAYELELAKKITRELVGARREREE